MYTPKATLLHTLRPGEEICCVSRAAPGDGGHGTFGGRSRLSRQSRRSGKCQRRRVAQFLREWNIMLRMDSSRVLRVGLDSRKG